MKPKLKGKPVQKGRYAKRKKKKKNTFWRWKVPQAEEGPTAIKEEG